MPFDLTLTTKQEQYWKQWKPQRCPLADEQAYNLWYIQTVQYHYTL